MPQLDAFQLLAVKFERAQVAEAVRRQVQALKNTKRSCSTFLKVANLKVDHVHQSHARDGKQPVVRKIQMSDRIRVFEK